MTEKESHHLCPFCEGSLTATVEWHPSIGKPYREWQVPLLVDGFEHNPAAGPGGEGRIQLIVCSGCNDHFPPSYYTHGHKLPPLPWGIKDAPRSFQTFWAHLKSGAILESSRLDFKMACYIQHAVNMYGLMLEYIHSTLDLMDKDTAAGIEWRDTTEYKEARHIVAMCAGVEAPAEWEEQDV